MDENTAIAVNNLTVSYQQNTVLRSVSVNIPAKRTTAIMGPNGAGKSTLFKAIIGLIGRDTGEISILDQKNDPSLLKQKRNKIAYIPQRDNIDWDFPVVVKDVVMMGQFAQMGWFGWTKKNHVDNVIECLEKVGMADYADRHIRLLSGGQQQRVFIARALCQEAEILFLDEPFVGVDAATQDIILSLIEELKAAGKTIIIINHDFNIIDKFDYLLLINKRLVAAGTPHEVFNEQNRNLTYGGQITAWDQAEVALRGEK